MIPASKLLQDTNTSFSADAKALRIKLGNTKGDEFIAVFDTAGENNSEFRVLIDANRDGAFSDTESAPLIGEDNKTHMPVIPVLATYEAGKTSTLLLQFSANGSSKSRFCRWRTARSKPTSIEWDTHEGIKGVLVDQPAGRGLPNGCFDTKGADMLLLDIDGNGKYENTERITVNGVAYIGGIYWNMTVDPAGDAVQLKPSELKLGRGTVTLGLHDPTATLEGTMSLQGTVLDLNLPLTATNAVSAPAGSFKLKISDPLCKTSDGKAWKANLQTSKPLVITDDGQIASMAIGAPFSASVRSADKAAKNRKFEVRLSVMAADKATEYRRFWRNNEAVIPQVTITAPDGTQLAQGVMKYG